jgi:hypothetical protein
VVLKATIDAEYVILPSGQSRISRARMRVLDCVVTGENTPMTREFDHHKAHWLTHVISLGMFLGVLASFQFL